MQSSLVSIFLISIFFRRALDHNAAYQSAILATQIAQGLVVPIATPPLVVLLNI